MKRRKKSIHGIKVRGGREGRGGRGGREGREDRDKAI